MTSNPARHVNIAASPDCPAHGRRTVSETLGVRKEQLQRLRRAKGFI
ncbi:MAG: hypothetical protein NTX42_07230 [Methanothrix sp.]|nr:hypothetical protein [Methanothrix sp.]